MILFQEWETARKDLISAVKHYCDTTIALETATANPLGHFSSTLELEDAIESICHVRASVLSRASELYDSEVYLNRIQNRSRKRVLINSLPPEILTRIFTLSCGAGCSLNPALSIFDYPVHETPETLLALTQVCTDWRGIVTNIPSLWSHIDIIHRNQDVNGDNILIQALSSLQRARNTPLSVHISVKSHYQIDLLVNCHMLFSTLQSATSLILGPAKTIRFFLDMIATWLAFVRTSQVHTLACLGAKGARTKLRLDWDPAFVRKEDLDMFLGPIRVLRLHNTYFDWDSVAYRGLVELSIGYLDDVVCPTVAQMADILSACPELRILRLQVMTFWNTDATYYEPVVLKYLEVLDLTGLRPDGVAVILPILSPGQQEISLRVNLTSQFEDWQALMAFLGRSNVVRLFIQGSGSYRPDLAAQMAPGKNLRVLIFDLNFDTEPYNGDKKLHVLIDPPGCADSELCSSLRPNLHTLYLINGQIGLDAVTAVVQSSRVRKLRLASCYMEQSEEETQQWLQPAIQDVRCAPSVDRRVLVRDWYEYMW